MSFPHSSRIVMLALATLATSCSGSDNPPLEDVAKLYGAAYCARLEVCWGSASFVSAYPGGQPDCSSRAMRISDTSEKSTCTQAQWDQCAADFKTTSCVSSSGSDVPRPKIPDSCQGC